MNTVFPSYDKFVQLEFKTLSWLRREMVKRRATYHIGDDVQRTVNLDSSQPYAFETYIDVEYEKRAARIFIGGHVLEYVENCITDLSYYISLVDISSKPRRVLRKYHFDYTCDGPDGCKKRRRNHPYFHLQYGGGLPGGMKRRGITEENLSDLLPEISEPRIACMPMSIALLFEMLFNEFPTKETEAIRSDAVWKHIVCENQKAFLEEYYEKCLEIIRKPVRLSDHVYIR